MSSGHQRTRTYWIVFGLSACVIAALIVWLWPHASVQRNAETSTGSQVAVDAAEFKRLKTEISQLRGKADSLVEETKMTEKAVQTLQDKQQAASSQSAATPTPTVGLAGPAGPSGARGLQGEAGPAGQTGAQGIPGAVSANCAGAACVSLQNVTSPAGAETGSVWLSGDVLAEGSLHAGTSVNLAGATSFPTPPDAGMVVYRTDLRKLFMYDGSEWKQLSSGITKIVAPKNSIHEYAADYVTDGTDDQIEIQAAIDSLPGAGVVVLTDGTYTISEAIRLRSDLTLSGMGTSTRVKAANGTSINLIESVGQEMIYHLNLLDFVLDGNAANTSGANGNALEAALDHADIARMRFENVRKSALRICPVAKAPTILCYLNVIRENEFTNVGEYGIWWDYPFTDSLIMDNNVGSTIANIRGQGGTSRIVNNHLDGAPEYNILLPDGGQSHMIIGNIIEHSSKGGIVYTMPPWEGSDVYQKIHIIGNLIRGCGLEADLTKSCVQIKGNGAGAPARGFNITSNTFEAKDVERPKSYISIENTDQVTITANEFSSSHSGVITDIEQLGTNSRLRIIGNTSANSDVIVATDASGTKVAHLDASGNLEVATAKVTGTLRVGGTLAYDITHIAATHTVQPTDHFVAVDASGGAVTINLPDASQVSGRELIIKASAANSGVILSAASGQDIDGSATLTLSNPHASVTLVSDNGSWHIIASRNL